MIHQQLGVRPFLNDDTLEVIPQVPQGQPSVEGSNIRLGSGSVGVFASHSGSTYTTKVDASDTPVTKLMVGHTLPAGSTVQSVELDGSKVSNFDTRTTNRGLEVTVPAKAGEQHTLVVTAG